jgi:quercetin dioxygenase-like cupin family protein
MYNNTQQSMETTMKFLLLAACVLTLAAAGPASKANAADTGAKAVFNGDNGVFPKGSPNDAYAQYFSGASFLQRLSNEGVPINNITFEPGCRNVWHIHHKGGQTLLVTEGRGWYQEWGKPAQELKPGDVVNIPAEAKHWHGAAKDSWFAHVSVAVPVEGASNEWLEPVSDEEYNKLK